jgi:vanillate O-demethylase ferredoxin subunit
MSELTTHKVRIRRVCAEADGVRSLELVAADGRALPPFDAGAHIDVHLSDGTIRQYSLINTTATDGSYRIAVKLEPNSRGGSRQMHALAEGASLAISAPRNNFALAAGAKHSVLLAGGIGVTPLLGMAYRLSAQEASFGLDYFARSREALAFADEIEGSPLRKRARFHLGLDGEGVHAKLSELLSRLSADTHVYACGPAPLMQAVRDILTARPGATLHLEYFAADPDVANMPAGAFKVRLAKSDKQVTVGADQTIVEALRDAGIKVETSCEQGVCGTCLTQVLAGRPDHRDMLLTPEEQEEGKMLLCVSRCLDDELVLDL